MNTKIIYTIALTILILLSGCGEMQINHLWDIEIKVKDHNAELISDNFVWLNDNGDIEVEIFNPTLKTFHNTTIWFNVFDLDKGIWEGDYGNNVIFGAIPIYTDYKSENWSRRYMKDFNIRRKQSYEFSVDLPCYCGGDKKKPIYRLISKSDYKNEDWVYCNSTDLYDRDLCQKKEHFVDCEDSCTLGQGEYLIQVIIEYQPKGVQHTESISESFYIFAKEIDAFKSDSWTEPLKEGGLFE